MSLTDLFSIRKARAAKAQPDVYTFDHLNERFRIQIVHIVRDCVGTVSPSDFADLQNPMSGFTNYGIEDVRLVARSYANMIAKLTREYGLICLNQELNSCGQILRFITECTTEECLDTIEVAFTEAGRLQSSYDARGLQFKMAIGDAISELNLRFQQHAFGYRLEAGRIIQTDSEYQHTEIIKPALFLLSDARFKSPLSEFLKAHEHFRKQAYKESMNECLKALESTLKVICAQRGWSHDANLTASKLIDLVFKEQLIPTYLTSHFTALRSLLESGVPPLRNRESGHGQGLEVRQVPSYLAKFTLNTSASCIVLLVEAFLSKVQ